MNLNEIHATHPAFQRDIYKPNFESFWHSFKRYIKYKVTYKTSMYKQRGHLQIYIECSDFGGFE